MTSPRPKLQSASESRSDPPQSSAACPGLGPDTYARWRASEIGRITERLERSAMLGLIGDVSGKQILDIGCGDGDFAIELARRGARVTGVDVSSEMIAAASAKADAAGLQVSFEIADARQLPFPSEAFDVIVAMTVLCFVPDASPVFHEVARVLRPGGRLVIGELGKWSTWAAARRLRAWCGSPLWRQGRFRTAAELRRLARAAGLEPAAVRGAIYYPRMAFLARSMQVLDDRFSRLTTLGAAFIAMSAIKPSRDV
jgi:ubiquinone biosynthesis O-methyltransferase